ncbi:MAG: hypothetical protein AAGC49_01645 [Brevundimonas sp.]
MTTALATYRPPPTVPSVVVVRRDGVPASAWFGQLRDGVLRLVWGDLAITADCAPTPAVRALAVADLVPPRSVVGRSSALWVHTGRHAPDRVEVLVARRARHTAPHPRRVSNEAELTNDDVVRLAGIRVTSIQRTGTDLARCLPAAQALAALSELVPLGFDPLLASHTLAAMRGHRHVRSALDVLTELRGQARIEGSSAPLAPVMR